ncbi:MAG: 4'-phosphopantetheinyl transferase superfamily protein [Candidatus Bathyarchaeota archaeon]|nr:4'-phosphopantetheinyl transferase superfamily protein [Candidatus Termiticorpusculum sp.]
MFKVIILRSTSDLMRDEYDVLFSLVSLEKQEHIKQICSFQDAQNSLIGDVLARVEICRATGLNNRQLEFAVNPCGKPFLANTSQVQFNISHAGHYVAFVISDAPVGIDVELIKTIDVKIVERFFMPDEQTYVLSAHDDVLYEHFFEVWTKKESRVKYEGKSLLESLSSFSVLNPRTQSEIFYHCIYNNGEIIGHVCSSRAEPPSVKMIDHDILLQYARSLK